MTSGSNERGLTLVEILGSIVILSIIFLSILRFFPQMGIMNNENEEKTKGINLAKEILNEWKNSDDVVNFLQSPSAAVLPGYDHADSNYYYFNTKKGDFDVYIKVKVNSDLRSTPIKTHLIDIQILNKRGNILNETFGYIIE